MLRFSLVFAVVVGAVGCNCERRMRHLCPPPSCESAEACPTPPPAPAKVEALVPEETAVKVPAPPAPRAAAPVTPPAAPQAVAQAAPQALAQAAPQAMMVPQGMAFGQGQPLMASGFAMPSMVPASPFGMAGATVTSSPPRTRLAFALTTIKIPLPWIRIIPVQGQQEFTVHVPQAQQPVVQSQAFFTSPMPMMPQSPLFVGQPSFQGSFAPTMPTPFVGAQAFPGNFVQGAAQGAPSALVCPPCPPCPPQNPGVSAERVQKLTAQIQELEQQLKAAAPKEPAKDAKDGK